MRVAGGGDIEAFFIFADYSALKQRMIEDGEFAKPSKTPEAVRINGFLIVRVIEWTRSADGAFWSPNTGWRNCLGLIE
jgi:hypothetical protein